MSYDTEFYDVIADGCLRSARAVVPAVIDLFDLGAAATVVDFGCGQGWWLSVYKENGCLVQGFDGSYVDQARLAIDPAEFTPIDLATTSPQLDHCFDLAMSLEVAEHLPEAAADRFVDDLCAASTKILFSAAIPAQGGTGHVNEQWPDYWVAKFAAHGYIPSTILQDRFWDDPAVECWYAQNMLLFRAGIYSDVNAAFEAPHNRPRRHVHPQFWQSRVIEA